MSASDRHSDAVQASASHDGEKYVIAIAQGRQRALECAYVFDGSSADAGDCIAALNSDLRSWTVRSNFDDDDRDAGWMFVYRDPQAAPGKRFYQFRGDG